jgi:hypothetical protein
MDHQPGLVEKDRLLLRVIRDNPATVRTELLRRFRDQTMPAVPSVPRRTVADLLDAVARNACERERRAAAQRADEQDATRQRGCLAHQHEWQPDAVR